MNFDTEQAVQPDVLLEARLEPIKGRLNSPPTSIHVGKVLSSTIHSDAGDGPPKQCSGVITIVPVEVRMSVLI